MEASVKTRKAQKRSATANWNDLRAAKNEMAAKLIHRPSTEVAQREQAYRFAVLRGALRAINPIPSENTLGIGIGEKISDGKQTGILAIKLLVRMKFPKSELRSNHVLPREIDGIPTDVEEVGIFRRFASDDPVRAWAQSGAMPNPRTKIRPAQPGCSIGYQDPSNQIVMAGTFGAVVKDKDGLYILSNNHVLADENRLALGAPIFQPGLLDGGNPSTDKIANLTKFETLQTLSANTVDCAIAKVTTSTIVSKDVLYIGAPQGTEDAAIDMAVHKFGRTTGYTVGRVTSIDTDVKVQYDLGNLTFSGQIIVVGNDGASFSNAGDSGSLILERGTNKAVALLFAGSPTHTIANHIDDVLSALKVTLA